MVRPVRGRGILWQRPPSSILRRCRSDLHRYTSTEQLGTLFGKTLRRLIEIERFDHRDIVVLTPKDLDHSCLPKLSLPGRLRLVTHDPAPRTQDVHCAAVDQFKGLESKVALVAELDADLPADESARRTLCHVAFSRPRHYLILFATPEAADVLPPDITGQVRA